MKVLIWISCMFVPSFIAMIAKDIGLILGGILTATLYCIAIFIARKLCDKFDWKKAMQAVSESGMSVNEYAKQGLSEEFVSDLPKLTYENMKAVLKNKKNKNEITDAQYILLLRLCSWTPGKDKFPEI